MPTFLLSRQRSTLGTDFPWPWLLPQLLVSGGWDGGWLGQVCDGGDGVVLVGNEHRLVLVVV